MRRATLSFASTMLTFVSAMLPFKYFEGAMPRCNIVKSHVHSHYVMPGGNVYIADITGDVYILSYAHNLNWGAL